MSEFFRAFGIDAKLLLAQVINFVILFFIYKKFLAKPIFAVFEKRRLAIEKTAHDAKLIEIKLQDIKSLQQKELAKVRQDVKRIIEEAKTRGETLAKKIVDEAEEKARILLEKTHEKILVEKQHIKDDLRGEFNELFFKALTTILAREFSEKDKIRILADIKKVMETSDLQS